MIKRFVFIYLTLLIANVFLYCIDGYSAKRCGSSDLLSQLVPDEIPGAALSAGGCASVDSAKFYRACRKHDECYENLTKTKIECDRQFLFDLQAECKRAFNTVLEKPCQAQCFALAQTYYEGVVGLNKAKQAWRRAQEEARERQRIIQANRDLGFAMRFRAVNDWSNRQGYESAYPNFHKADYGDGKVYGTILVKSSVADWIDISAAELGNPSTIEERFRAVHNWANNYGYVSAFPNFHQADYGDGIVYGTILIKSTAADRRDVPLKELK